jgi:hypothetical protein
MGILSPKGDGNWAVVYRITGVQIPTQGRGFNETGKKSRRGT